MKLSTFFQYTLCFSALIVMSSCSRTAQISPPQILPPAGNVTISDANIQTANNRVEIAYFVANEPLSLMSEGDKDIAAKTQYNALQFGRPGAPRKWTGDAGNKGKIIVGPFIQRDGLICREFEHEVTTNQILSTFSAIACRSTDGTWSVVV